MLVLIVMEKVVVGSAKAYDLSKKVYYKKLFRVGNKFFVLEYERRKQNDIHRALEMAAEDQYERIFLGYEPIKQVQLIFKNHFELYGSHAVPLEIENGRITRPAGKKELSVNELEDIVVECLRKHAPREAQPTLKRVIAGYAQKANTGLRT